jgi:osmotically-inducible protein OsmY
MIRNLLICALLAVLTSCVETVVVGTVTTGALLTREKTLDDTRIDMVIASKISTDLISHGFISIDADVEEQRVLLTGIADAQDAKKAVSLCWRVKEVKEVIDEIQVFQEKPRIENRFTAYARDAIITTQIKSRILFYRNISSANFEVTTVNSVVYLTGIAADESEVDKINSIAAKTKGVSKVVSHIVTADDSRRKS